MLRYFLDFETLSDAELEDIVTEAFFGMSGNPYYSEPTALLATMPDAKVAYSKPGAKFGTNIHKAHKNADKHCIWSLIITVIEMRYNIKKTTDDRGPGRKSLLLRQAIVYHYFIIIL
jgi:hypothetical protein